MKLRYIDRIRHLSLPIVESIIRESPHTRIQKPIPEVFSFLDGAFVDLGFENLPLPAPQRSEVFLAFLGDGVAAPGTGYKLRYERTGVTVIEPDDGALVLPDEWMETVLVTGEDNNPIYVGSRVRPDQLPPFWRDNYGEVRSDSEGSR